MNKERRKAIESVVASLDNLKSEAETLAEQIRELESEEQEYFDNMPESLQGGEKGDTAQTAIDALSSAADELEGFDFESVMAGLGSAAE